MFLLSKTNQTLLEVLSVQDLFDPFVLNVNGRLHAGEELQDPGMYPKSELVFPSGEALPQCWTDPHYRDRVKSEPCSSDLEMAGCGCA